MIVDTHYHYVSLPRGGELPQAVVHNWILTAECAGVKKPPAEVIPVYEDYLDDPRCHKLIGRMDESGIDVSVLLIVDNIRHGLDRDRLMRLHERCANAAAENPVRLIALASVDPRRPQAPELLRTVITNFKMRGLKWHTGAGFYPNSPEAYAVLKVADDLGLPLLVHTSPLPEYASKYSHPLHLDDIAHDFPNLQIIAAHAGEGWWRDWLAIAKYKKNLFGDSAIWQLTAVSKPHLFRRHLREILDTLGPERLLFGSDGPILEPFVSTRTAVDHFRALTQRRVDGITFSEEEVTAILGGNAARIFGLREIFRNFTIKSPVHP